MGVNAFQANQGTQSNLLTDNTGGVSGTLIPVMKVSLDGQGTFTSGGLWAGGVTGTINTGSIVVTAGTIVSDTIVGGTLQNLASGTINSATVTGTLGTIGLGTVVGKDANAGAQVANPISIAGTDSGGTVYTLKTDTKGQIYMGGGSITTLPNLPQGSINVTAGTIGTILSIGTLPNLPQGSINVTAGTIGTVLSVGTLPNIPGGSIAITAGTIGTVLSIGTLPNLPQGSINITAGTIGTVLSIGTLPNLPQGSINVTAGTIGTVTGVGVVSALTAGTLSPIPTIANVTYGTHGTTGVSVFGTLAGGTGSGAGTEIFCTSVSLSIPSTGGSQDVSIGWGTNGGTFHAGTGLIVRGNFPPGGGIQKTFWPPINSGTQAQLCMFQAGAGTVDVNISYLITASTL